MVLKAIQKIVRNGCSAQVTLPRQILFHLGLRPGDLVELNLDDDGVLRIRGWIDRSNVSHKSPGMVTPEPPAVAR